MDAGALLVHRCQRVAVRAIRPIRRRKFSYSFYLLRYGVAIAAARLSALRLVLSIRRGLRDLIPFALSTFALARSATCFAIFAGSPCVLIVPGSTMSSAKSSAALDSLQYDTRSAWPASVRYLLKVP